METIHKMVTKADAAKRAAKQQKDETTTTSSNSTFEYLDEVRTPFHFQWLSLAPRVAYIPEFFTDDECDDLIRAASKELFQWASGPVALSRNR